MTRGLQLGALLVLSAGTAMPAAAQHTSGLSFELSAAYRTADDSLLAHLINPAPPIPTVYFRGLGMGVGLDAEARYTWDRWSVGAAVQHTIHGIDNVIEHLHFTSVGLEPRYAVPFGSVSAYVSGHVARLSYRVASGGDEQSAHGVAFGGGAGVLVPFWPTVRLRVAVTYSRASLGDPELNGSRVSPASRDGPLLSLQIGLAARLGR